MRSAVSYTSAMPSNMSSKHSITSTKPSTLSAKQSIMSKHSMFSVGDRHRSNMDLPVEFQRYSTLVQQKSTEKNINYTDMLKKVTSHSQSQFEQNRTMQSILLAAGAASASSSENSLDKPYEDPHEQEKRLAQLPDTAVWTKLCTGNSYYGRWNQFGFEGFGLYRFMDGLLYEGTLRMGRFHGAGTLHFPNGNRINGFWQHGLNRHMRFQFSDGLAFKEYDWQYLEPEDRR